MGGVEDGRRRTSAKIGLASLAAAVAETATFPIDIIKTRLQLRHGHSSGSAALRVAADIWNKGGLLGFYNGLSPAVLRHLFYTPVRIVSYEYLRTSSSDADTPILCKALAGGASGVAAQVLASPADLVKVRMQADGHFPTQGLQPRYTGIFNAFRKTAQSEGFLGLWRGVFPNAQRAFLVNMGELTCYDSAKHFIIDKEICEDNMFAHTLASVASGLCATALSCPADVVKTRMMNQDAVKDVILYRNSFDCFMRTIRCEGIFALWKGFFPTWARLGPWQCVFWVSYEKFRQVSGLSSF